MEAMLLNFKEFCQCFNISPFYLKKKQDRYTTFGDFKFKLPIDPNISESYDSYLNRLGIQIDLQEQYLENHRSFYKCVFK